MGFITPSSTWSESDAEVTVRVVITGVPRSSLDLFASSCYLKVNAPPYLFSCDLYGEIVDDKCVATVDETGVVFRCPKAVVGVQWGRLRREFNKHSSIEERNVLAERRRASVEQAHARVVAERELELKKQQETDKAYLEKQWQIERNRRETIEQRQDVEIAEERERLKKWQEDGDKRAAAGGPSVDSDEDYDSDDDLETRTAKQRNTRQAREREFADSILTPEALVAAEDGDGGGSKIVSQSVPDAALDAMVLNDDEDDEETEKKLKQTKLLEERQKAKARAKLDAIAAKEAQKSRPVPPPRPRQSPVSIEFTKLETDHMPARASREKEIKEWKRKNNGSTDGSDSNKDKTDITSREPIYLKDKGDSFFKAGDFRSAVVAYTTAIDTEKQAPHPDGVLIKILANRAACFFKVDEFDLAVEDCGDALDLLAKEETDADYGAIWSIDALKKQRFKLLVRRAAAYGELGDALGAVRDLQIALLIAPDDETKEKLELDLNEAKRCLTPLNIFELRATGDERYRAGDVHGAEKAYSAALAMPVGVGGDVDDDDDSDAVSTRLERSLAFANRAACSLQQSDHGAAHDDCDEGLDVFGLGVGFDSKSAREAAETWTDDENVYSEKMKNVFTKLLHRRAAAAAHLFRYEDAALDYEACAALANDEETKQQLVKDAETVRALASGGD